jgi:hypothetical protein
MYMRIFGRALMSWDRCVISVYIYFVCFFLCTTYEYKSAFCLLDVFCMIGDPKSVDDCSCLFKSFVRCWSHQYI